MISIRRCSLMLAKMRCRGHALSCFIDEVSSDLDRREAGRGSAAGSTDSDLVVNSSFRYSPKGEAPPEIGRRVVMDGFLRGIPLAWIEDSGTGMWWPFWVRDEWVEAIESLRPGEPAPSALPALVRQTLAMAKVLVPPGGERERSAAWEQVCREAGAGFQRYGYAIVRDLIHLPLPGPASRRPPVHVALLLLSSRGLRGRHILGGLKGAAHPPKPADSFVARCANLCREAVV